jgi:RHS repeat-associated protein
MTLAVVDAPTPSPAVAPAVAVSTLRYGFAGPGASPALTVDGAGELERLQPLLGGVLVTRRAAAGGDVWSYPGVHGDVVALADAAGAKQGPTRTYDPFGGALAGVPDNTGGRVDYGWLGQHQRGCEADAGGGVIEMGARMYVPGLGRFLEVAPVEGGSANDYDYVAGDPVNTYDLDGRICYSCAIKKGGRYVRRVVVSGGNPLVVASYYGPVTATGCVFQCVSVGMSRSGGQLSLGIGTSGWNVNYGRGGALGILMAQFGGTILWKPSGRIPTSSTSIAYGGCYYGGFAGTDGIGAGTRGVWAGPSIMKWKSFGRAE